MALEDLEKKLYGAEEEATAQKKILETTPQKEANENNVSEKWNSEELISQPFKDAHDAASIMDRYPVKKYIIRGMIVISIIAVFVVGYLLYQAYTYSGVSIQINLEEQILAGVPFNVTINYSNNSPAVLNNAKITLKLPPEFSFAEGSASLHEQSVDIGTVGMGTVGQQAIKVTAQRGEGTCADVVATITYKASGVGSSFEKNFTQSVCVGASAASLNIFNPNQVFSNKAFDVKIGYSNISKENLQNLELRLEYPQNYTFKSATLKPDVADNIWRLGDLRAGSSNDITINGSIIAQADSFFEMRMKLVSKSDLSEYVVAEKSVSISVSQPPLSITITNDSSGDHVTKSGETLNYTLQFKNNTDIGFRDVIIKARLTGEMYDYTSIDKTIDFNSATHELTWNKSNLDTLGLILPGTAGSVSFKVRVNDAFPISKLTDKNFTLKVEAQIDSPTVPTYTAGDHTESADLIETKVAGLVKIESKGLFRDASSGIKNNGPLPPRVGVSTNYTIHWVIKNYGTDVSGVEIRAFLKPGVKATAVIKSNVDTAPIYNDRTQELVWNIPKIQATRGVISDPIEAVIQIEALPAVNQVGSSMPLISETVIRALDLFSNLNLSYTAGAIDTYLNNNDTTLKLGDSKVSQ